MFKLQTTDSVIKDPNEGITKFRYRQVKPRAVATGASFAGSEIVFENSVAGNTWWIPNRSRIEIKATITVANAKPVAGDAIAPAMNFCGSLFNSADMRINGQSLGGIRGNLSQSDTMYHYLNRGQTFFYGEGYDTNFWASEFGARQDSLSAKNTFNCSWTPSLGVFDYKTALPAGKYELILNAKSDFKKACVESEALDKVIGIGVGEYDVVINDIIFWMCVVDGEAPPKDIEYQIVYDSINANYTNVKTGHSTHNFTVSKSTYGLAVALQGRLEKTGTGHPTTKFIVQNDDVATKNLERSITYLQVHYGDGNYPDPGASLLIDANSDTSIQLYEETMIYSGNTNERNGGCINHGNWLARGLYAFFRIGKAGNDTTTTCDVDITTTTLPVDGANLFLFDISRKVAIVKIENGNVVLVVAQDA